MFVLRLSFQTSFHSKALIPKIPILLPILYHPYSPDLRSSSLFVKLFSTQEVYASNVKIGSLSRAGKIESARKLFDKMPEKDIVSWNAIITGYWQNGFLEESKRLFAMMPERNVVSWNSMIAGCVESDRVGEAFDYFLAMPKKNTASWNAMISGFVKYDHVEEAIRLFEEMPKKNVISYTAMIDGYAKRGEVEKARALFDCMPCKNAVSYTVMISGYLESGKVNEAEVLFEQMPNKTLVATTAMITGFCIEGNMENARALFESVQIKDLVCWNSIITGYAQNRMGEEALKLFSEMHRKGVHPDHATLVSVFTACSGLASLKEGRQIHVLVVKDGLETNISICNTLISMYAKCGSIHDSESAFRQARCLDLVSWNSIIAAFAQHGLYQKALGFFKQMVVSGFKPDDITFLCLLSACGHGGRVDESMDLFDSMMNDYDIPPRSEHYACLVDILGRAGQLDKAYKIIHAMPFEADSRVWSALLAACGVYLNVELGELAAKKLVDLDPQNSGAFVVLSNIYAAAGMWRDVTRVRLLMREHNVKKQNACSWMEIDNEVHSFQGGDISHPLIDRIHLELRRMSLEMKGMDDVSESILACSCFG